MSEDAGSEKRFDASPARRERAKREGNAAKSAELSGVAAFAGGLAALSGVLPVCSGLAADAIRSVAAQPLHPNLVPAANLVALAFVPACTAALGATFVSLPQAGGLHIAAIAFSPAKLAPLPGLKRMFGGEAAVAAARATLAFAAATAVLVPLGYHVLVAAGGARSLAAAAYMATDAIVQAAWTACGIGALFALADYALARRRWLTSLKMTFDAFKRDLKEQDGDPQAKAKRKQMHRVIARSGIGRTAEASFVVVNPTHVAIAVKYAPPEVPVPEILVRAADAVALDVKAIAVRAGIPVVENVPLARLLYRTGEGGRPIPAEAFVAVAEVIAALVREGVLRV